MRQVSYKVESARWKRAACFAAPICLFLMGIFYYWFAVADRYAIFLYGHLGATPFDTITASRYWMSGLVASGFIMVGYSGINWLLGRLELWQQRRYYPPNWRQIWLLCALPLALGIPIITMSFNWPVLPFRLALVCLFVVWIGLALALMPGSWAVERPAALVWLLLDGIGLMPCLLLLKTVELPGRGIFDHTVQLSVVGEIPTAYLVAGGTVIASVVWSGIMTLLRKWRRKHSPGAIELFVAGLCLSFLLMPVLHYLLEAPAEYRYITAAANFFAGSPWVQGIAFLIAAFLAWGSTRIRHAWHV